MAFGEPLDWTLKRQQDATQYFSTLEDFSPDENIDIDMSMFERGDVPSTFSQSAMNLAGYAAQSRMPQQQQAQEPGLFSKLFSFIGEVDKPISTRLGFKAEGDGIASSLENIAMEEATRPSNIALSALGLFTGGLSTGAAGARIAASVAARSVARNVGMGIGARIAGNVAEQGLESAGVENPYIRGAVGLGAGALGGSLAGGATSWARVAKMGIMQGDEAVTAAARAELAAQEAAQTARQQSRYGYLVEGLGTRFGQGTEVGIGMPAENVYAGLPPMGARPNATRTFPQGSAQAAAGVGVPPAAAAGGAGAGGIGGRGTTGGTGGAGAGGIGGNGTGGIGGSTGNAGGSIFQQQNAANQAAQAAKNQIQSNIPPSWSTMSWGDRALAILAMPMHMRSTFDVSAPRQLSTLLAGNVLRGAEGIEDNYNIFKESYKALANETNFRNHFDSIVNGANAKTYANMGLEFSDLIGTREEQIGSAILGKLPGIRNSDRAYAAAINEARKGLADTIIEKILKTDPSLIDNVDEMKKIGRFIMASTGRGDLLNAIAENKILGQSLIWAPRLLASRIQLPVTMFTSLFSETGRKYIAPYVWKQMAAFAGINGALLQGLKSTGAADVDWDPRSSDFGQIRYGDRRYDTLGGYKPIVNLFTRVGINAYNSITGSDVDNVKQPYDMTGDSYFYNRNNQDVVLNFLKNKMAPVPAAILNQWQGENILGERVGSSVSQTENIKNRSRNLFLQLLVPMSLENIWNETSNMFSENAKQYGARRAYEIAFGNFGKSLVPSLIYAHGVGGSLYLPDPKQIAYMGRYSDMSPEKQLQAIRDLSWYLVRDYYGGSNVQSYRAFEEMHKKNLARIYSAYYPNDYAVQLAESNYPKLLYVDTAYNDVKNMYENEWVAENPTLAFMIDVEDLNKPITKKRLGMTDFQSMLAGERIQFHR